MLSNVTSTVKIREQVREGSCGNATAPNWYGKLVMCTCMHTYPLDRASRQARLAASALCKISVLPLQAVTSLVSPCSPVSPAWKKYGKLTPMEYGMVRASFRSHKEWPLSSWPTWGKAERYFWARWGRWWDLQLYINEVPAVLKLQFCGVGSWFFQGILSITHNRILSWRICNSLTLILVQQQRFWLWYTTYATVYMWLYHQGLMWSPKRNTVTRSKPARVSGKRALSATAVRMASLIWETFSILESKREKMLQKLSPMGLPSQGLSCEMGPPGVFPKCKLPLNLTTSFRSLEEQQ